MAFPTIPTVAGGRVLSTNQLDSSGTRTFPSLSSLTKASGDLLIAVVVCYQSSLTSAIFSAWGASFTEFHDSGGTSEMCVGMAYKWSDGTETGTFTVTQGGTITGDATLFLLSIPGAHASTIPEAGSRAVGTAAAADPAAFNPAGWAAEDTLWISVVGSGMTSGTGSWAATGTTGPTNYTSWADSNATDTSTIGDCEAAVSFRQLNAASEDVGTVGVDLSNARNVAVVVAVRPAPTVLAAGSNTVTITAPAQSQLAEITLAAGLNIVTITAPIQSQLVNTPLAAGQNAVTASAPTIPAVNLTMPQAVNTVTASAPTATLLQILDLAAGSNPITTSAPTVPAVHLTMPQTVNTVTVTAGTAALLVGIQPKKNLQIWSEDFSNTAWWSNNNGDATGADLTYNSTTAPDGATTAAFMEEDTTSLFHNIMSWGQVTFSHDRSYANVSIHVKPSTLEFFYLALYDFGVGTYQRNFIFQGFRLVGAGELIDPYTGLGVNYYYGDRSTAGAHTATIEALPNGWYRISAGGFLEKPSAGVGAEFGLGKPPVGVPGSMDAEQYFDWVGNGTSGLWIWGAQIEEFTNKSQYIKTTSATVANDVMTFGGVTTAITAPGAQLNPNLHTPAANTVTISAPTVPAAHLTMPQTTNTVTVSVSDATLQGEAGSTTLQAGQNTITLSAPSVPAVHLTLPQTANTITVSAPEETLLAATTLAAGQNTITVSAPEETLLAATTLAAGQNTITVSALIVPSLALTMPQTTNTVTITATNAEIIQAGNLLAVANIVTVSAPTIPAVHLALPQATNTLTVSAPAETTLAETAIAAAQNVVTVSAPTAAMIVHPLMTATVNTVNFSAPPAALLSLDQFLEALENSVTVSAPHLAGVHLLHVLEANTVTVTAPPPAITVTFDSILEPGASIILIQAPILTVQPQYGGDTIYRETARLRFTQHETLRAVRQTVADVRLVRVHSETRRTKLE